MSLCSTDTGFAEPKESGKVLTSSLLGAAHESKGTFELIDPLGCVEWDGLLSGAGEQTFFHGRAWAQVLHETYGHRPFYFCRMSGSRLEALLPTMEVSSWFTGARGVALPFTDECPLRMSQSSDQTIYDSALDLGRRRGWRYLESRDKNGWPGARTSLSFYSHRIGLEGSPDAVSKRFAPSFLRGIRKAEKTGLKVRFETQGDGISIFYKLHCSTRRRLGVPPQPLRFFQNIERYVFQAGQGFAALGWLERKPVAAAIFFHRGKQAVYKFGAWDRSVQDLRPNNVLMWEAIKHCAELGCDSVHLGRTSICNEGLRRFKLNLGAREEQIDYARYDLRRQQFVTDVDRAGGWHNHFFRRLPMPVIRLAGRLLYPHWS